MIGEGEIETIDVADLRELFGERPRGRELSLVDQTLTIETEVHVRVPQLSPAQHLAHELVVDDIFLVPVALEIVVEKPHRPVDEEVLGASFADQALGAGEDPAADA